MQKKKILQIVYYYFLAEVEVVPAEKIVAVAEVEPVVVEHSAMPGMDCTVFEIVAALEQQASDFDSSFPFVLVVLAVLVDKLALHLDLLD